MECDFCGICCTAVSIGKFPDGSSKPAGVRCKYLKNNLCSVWGTDLQPKVCQSIKPNNDLCRFDLRGTEDGTKKHYQHLIQLERLTRP